jgi:hypothetical protein
MLILAAPSYSEKRGLNFNKLDMQQRLTGVVFPRAIVATSGFYLKIRVVYASCTPL